MPKQSHPRAKRSAQQLKRHAKHVLVPHKGNQYQPHLIRKTGLIIVLTIIFTLQFAPYVPGRLAVLGESTDMTSQVLLDATNQQRLSQQLEPLELDRRLTAAATAKANDMLANQYWSHTSPDGTTPWYWLREQNYRYSYAGENLGRGFTDPEAIVTAWMNSPEHRKNMLSPDYTDVGFAVVTGQLEGEETSVIVALYARPLRQAGSATQAVLGDQASPSLIARIGMTLQSLSPTALATTVLLLIVALVAMWAHMYRKNLPKPIRKSWKRHHGMYTFIISLTLAALFIALYDSGQMV